MNKQLNKTAFRWSTQSQPGILFAETKLEKSHQFSEECNGEKLGSQNSVSFPGKFATRMNHFYKIHSSTLSSPRMAHGFPPSFETFPTFERNNVFSHSLEKSAKNPALESSRKICPIQTSSCVQIRWGRLMINLLFPVGALQRCWFWLNRSHEIPIFLGNRMQIYRIFEGFPWYGIKMPPLENLRIGGTFFLGGNRMQPSDLAYRWWKNHPKNDSMVLYPKIQVMNRELKGIKSEKKTNPCESSLSTNPMKLWIIPTQKMVRIPQKKTHYNSLCPLLGWFSSCWWPPTRPRGIKGSRIESPGQLVGPRA